MKKPLLVGITGGIGGGKSTLSDRLMHAGYAVYNSDMRARILQQENRDLVKAIKQLLGDDAYTASGELNRPLIASRVFNDTSLLDALNKLVHPVVRADLSQWIYSHQTEAIVFVESAIMYESGLVGLMDKVILMTASEDVRVSRVMKRDHVSAEQVRARMKHQMADEKKMKMADYVIFSDDNLPLIEKMERVLQALRTDCC